MTSTARIAPVLCSLSMATLIRDGLDLRYEVTGTGPALLLPAFNFRWGDYLDVALLAGRFTVVTASPAPSVPAAGSTRTPATGSPIWRATWSP